MLAGPPFRVQAEGFVLWRACDDGDIDEAVPVLLVTFLIPPASHHQMSEKPCALRLLLRFWSLPKTVRS